MNAIYAIGSVFYLRLILEAAILMKVIPYIFGNRKCDIIPVFVIRKLRVRETTSFIQNNQLVWELRWRSISDSYISESVCHKRNEQLTLEEHSSLCHTLYQLPRWALKFSHIHYSHISNCEYSWRREWWYRLSKCNISHWNLFFWIYVLDSRKYPLIWNTSEF